MPKGFVNPVTGNKLLELEYQNLVQAKKQLRKSSMTESITKNIQTPRTLTPCLGNLMPNNGRNITSSTASITSRNLGWSIKQIEILIYRASAGKTLG